MHNTIIHPFHFCYYFSFSPFVIYLTQTFPPVEVSLGSTTVLVQIAGGHANLANASPQATLTQMDRGYRSRTHGLTRALGNTPASTVSPNSVGWGAGTTHPTRPLGTLTQRLSSTATASCLRILPASGTHSCSPGPGTTVSGRKKSCSNVGKNLKACKPALHVLISCCLDKQCFNCPFQFSIKLILRSTLLCTMWNIIAYKACSLV